MNSPDGFDHDYHICNFADRIRFGANQEAPDETSAMMFSKECRK
jgi:hypothetical protein